MKTKKNGKKGIKSAREIAAERNASPKKPKAAKKAPVAAETAGQEKREVQPREVDARLPAVGTVIEKKDRHGQVRCRCEVLEGGRIAYARQEYSSISAAALAAARDLGLTNKTYNGFVFWGLSQPKRPAKNLAEAFAKFSDLTGRRLAALLGQLTDEQRGSIDWKSLRNAGSAIVNAATEESVSE